MSTNFLRGRRAATRPTQELVEAGPALSAALRVVRRTSALIIGGWIVVLGLTTALWPWASQSVTVALLGVGAMLLAWLAWVARIAPGWVVPAAAVLLGPIEMMNVAELQQIDASLPALGWSGLIGVSVALVLSRRIWRAAVCLVSLMILCALVGSLLLFGDPELRFIVMSSTSALMYGMISGAIVDTVLKAGANDDIAAHASLQAVSNAAGATARATESFRIGRLLHDGVINTLGSIRWADPRRDPDLIRQRCARDLSKIEHEWFETEGSQTRQPGSLAALMSGATWTASLNGLSLTSQVTGTCEQLPTPVFEAISGALDESIINVAKHADVGQLELSISCDHDQIRVELNDAGRGLPEAREILPSGGITQSIHERCARVGVSSTIESAPGRGTMVILNWHAPKQNPQSTRTEAIVLQSALVVMAAQISGWLIGRLAIDMIFDWGLVPLWWWLTASSLILVGTGLGLLAGRRHIPLRRPVGLCLIAIIGVLALLPGVSAGSCQIPGYGLWPAMGSVVVLLVLTVLTRGSLWVLSGLAVLIVGMAVSLFLREAQMGCSTELGVFVAVYAAAVCAMWAVRGFVQTFGRRAQEAMLRTQRGRELEETAIQLRLVQTTAWENGVAQALSLVRGIANGTLDPHSVDTKRTAWLQESLLRNYAQLDACADPIHQVLLTVCKRASQRGIAITLNPATLPPTPDRDDLGLLQEELFRAVDSAAPGSRATITELDTQAGGIITCLTAPEEPICSGESRSSSGGLSISTTTDSATAFTEISWLSASTYPADQALDSVRE